MAAVGLLALTFLSTLALAITQVSTEDAQRSRRQQEAHKAFLAQPARHPHRVVHYGHFVFRSPAPLAAFDPGLDPVTGQAIYLEGHRQNTATFATRATGARLGELEFLTPSLVYQLFAPLLLVILGFGTVAREREAATLVPLLMQGASGASVLLGKFLALASVALALMVPVFGAGVWSMGAGESLPGVLAITGACGLYLLAWCALAITVSAALRSRHAALAALIAAWISLALVMPGLAVNLAALSVPVPGKTEADLRMLADQRSSGDGHDASDPAFARLRTELLLSYGAEKPEELPINMRGVVAQYAEEKLSRLMNERAESVMAAETAQARFSRRFGWLSPAVAFATASRALAGTDLETHHRFLRESEALRYDFVQALNRIHAEDVAYADDVNRSRDAAAEGRTRVDPGLWRLMEEFRFEPSPVSSRVLAAAPSLLMLLFWLAVPAAAFPWLARRLESLP
jgi:ABC-2 type transport system permease protein